MNTILLSCASWTRQSWCMFLSVCVLVYLYFFARVYLYFCACVYLYFLCVSFFLCMCVCVWGCRQGSIFALCCDSVREHKATCHPEIRNRLLYTHRWIVPWLWVREQPAENWSRDVLRLLQRQTNPLHTHFYICFCTDSWNIKIAKCEIYRVSKKNEYFRIEHLQISPRFLLNWQQDL